MTDYLSCEILDSEFTERSLERNYYFMLVRAKSNRKISYHPLVLMHCLVLLYHQSCEYAYDKWVFQPHNQWSIDLHVGLYSANNYDHTCFTPSYRSRYWLLNNRIFLCMYMSKTIRNKFLLCSCIRYTG